MNHTLDETDHNSVMEELAMLSPQLTALKKQLPVVPYSDMPEGYFEGLQQTIASKISGTKRSAIVQPAIWRWAAIAASLALVLGFSVYSLQHTRPGNQQVNAALSEINDEAITQYIESNLHAFDAAVLWEALADENEVSELPTVILEGIPEEDWQNIELESLN